MKLTVQEFEAMQSKSHLWFNEHGELAGFKRWGLKIPGADILEVGCGWGYCASLIMREKPHSYVGLDVMPEQLEIARSRELDGARFEQGDAADLSRFADNSFDYILDFCILHHVEGWRSFLQEAHRVLKPGGSLFVHDLSKKGVHLVDFFSKYDHSEVPLFTLKEFEEQAKKSGLTVAKRWNWAWLDGFYRIDKK